MGLTHRSRKILFSLVAEYIATGEAVGSRTIARKYVVDLSPATIRNVLFDLEDAGLLRKPHTSAGRIPTENALRAFVEALTEFQQIPHIQQCELRERFEEIFAKRDDLNSDALHQTGLLISEMAGAAAIVARSKGDTRKLNQLRFIVINSNRLLAVLVFSNGMVENRYIEVAESVLEADLLRVHNLLTDVVEGRTLGALRELFARRLDDERVRFDELRAKAFDLASKVLEQTPSEGTELVIEGGSKLLELPEYADVDKLKRLVCALEDRKHLLQLMDMTIEAGAVSVYFGTEIGMRADLGAAQLSFVAAPYGDGEKSVGTVGVLGPTRMDYSKMMPLVDATAAAMTAAIKKTK